MRTFSLTLAFLLFFVSSGYADTEAHQNRLRNATLVLEEMMESGDEYIPHDLIAKAKAIMIFPTMVKGGFIFAVRGGIGVASVRSKISGKWGLPAFFYTGGLSFGFQAGAEAVDLILLIMTERGIEGLLKDHFTLGVDAAVSAGPVGRYAEAGADILMQGEIYSYSRSKGAFAGISFKGTAITPNRDGNTEYYGNPYSAKAIMIHGKVDKVPESAKRYMDALDRLAPPKTKARK